MYMQRRSHLAGVGGPEAVITTRVATHPARLASSVARWLVVVAVAGVQACRSAAVPPPSVPDERPPAPWAHATHAADAVSPVYVSAWRSAENRQRCALLAPARLSADVAAQARPRSATFSGGWGVAYDLPTERSAFGVAGTGVSAWTADVYDAWPQRRTFADGSRVGYGPEGGTGPNWLAYVRITGQDCLYNVWSRRGRAHLEQLLAELRFVATE
jgi:hypothetical protein